jgi:6-phosphogluconolactonase (cycloisomerase 2 family)
MVQLQIGPAHATPRRAGLATAVACAVLPALCSQGCGATPANPVSPLTPTTLVYTFERDVVHAYQVDANGKISEVNKGQRFRRADRNWDRLIADPTGRFLFATVEQPGEVWVFPLDGATGAPSLLEASPFTPRTPHSLHGAVIAPQGRMLYLAGEPGPNTRGDVSAFRIDPVSGALTEIDSSPFGADFGAYRPWIDPEGRYLYVANNGSGSLAVYAVDPASGALTEVPGSPYDTPTFTGYVQFHPSGRFLYATANRFFLAYGIGADGSLSELNPPPRVPADVKLEDGDYVRALSVTADGRFLYAVEDSGYIFAYAIDAGSGAPSLLSSAFGEPPGSWGFAGAAFHWSQPLALFLGREKGSQALALTVYRIDASSGSLVDPRTLELDSGLQSYAAGSLFLDASGGIVCVFVNDSGPLSSARAHLRTYRLAPSGALDGPVDSEPLGDGSGPFVVAVRRGMAPQAGGVAAP